MAYDQNSTYEPPKRAYMAQRQPQPNPGYSDYNAQYDQYDQYNQYDQQNQYERHDNHGHYDQHYAQPQYDQHQGYNGSYGRRGNMEQEQAYDDNYGGGYGAQQSNGRYYQQREDRNFDERYQQRPPRDPSQQQQSRPQRGPPTGKGLYQSDPRAGPRQPTQGPVQAQRARDQPQRQNGNQYQNHRTREQHGQPSGYSNEAHPERDEFDRRTGQRDLVQPRGGARNPGKSSMEEWKTREKAKMKQDAASPEVLPFDNAFPVFGKKKDRPSSDRSGGAGTPHQRLSADSRQAGMPVENGPPPATSRGESHYPMEDMHQRLEMDRQYSAPEIASARQDQPPINHRDAYQNPRQYSQPPSNTLRSPVRQDYPDQWPMMSSQSPPKGRGQRRSPVRDAEHDTETAGSGWVQTSQRGYEQYNQGSAPQKFSGQRAPPSIDTSQDYQPPQPQYMDHQPLSPAYIPPRPSTSQGQRTLAPRQAPSPWTQQSQSGVPHDSHEYNSGPWSQEQHTRHGSLDDIYANYGSERAPPKTTNPAPKTREEEIEADMPNFDSAAPGQTSGVQKRIQNATGAQVMPPMQRTQTAPPSAMPHAQPAQSMQLSQTNPQRSYTSQDVHHGQPAPQQYEPRPTPGPRAPPKRGMTVDGYGGAPMPMLAQERQFDVPHHNGSSQEPQYGNTAYQQDAALSPPHAPYAVEPPVRRSFDDARRMPQRQGPPQPQRFYPNGQPSQGQHPAPRPNMNPGGPPGRSNSGQDRMGSVPYRQGLQGPAPDMSKGAPLGQQRSAPERSNNPDALPRHPTPVRPGHMLPGQPQSAKPLPARNHNDSGPPPQSGQPHQRQASADHFAQPVTHAELDRLRAAVDSTRSPRQELILVKKLVEAASVLANEAGRVDAKTTARNRELFMNEAYKRLKKLVAGGYPDAQFYMADCYGQGIMGLEVDTKEAFKLYQAAAKAGHAQAAYRTAVCCEMGPEEGGGTNKDFPKAVQWYRRAAALGDSAAMYKLGALLLKGLLGQQRNIGEAVNWLKRGAEKADRENPHALHELAMLYESTNTNPEIRNKVVADDGYARELYQQASQLGYKFSQFRLGQAYEYGNLGLAIDNRSSIAWYTKAAAQGEHQAELALSGWYLTGADGILEHSDTEAYLWARKAASSEPPLGKAMFAMGYFTENGIGCPASLEEARKWYGRAAGCKFPKAVQRLEELKRSGGKPGSKNAGKPPPMNGKLTRKDQKRDEENCTVM